jgi:hypothetical protein
MDPGLHPVRLLIARCNIPRRDRKRRRLTHSTSRKGEPPA